MQRVGALDCHGLRGVVVTHCSDISSGSPFSAEPKPDAELLLAKQRPESLLRRRERRTHDAGPLDDESLVNARATE
jgi:hypothetical protein